MSSLPSQYQEIDQDSKPFSQARPHWQETSSLPRELYPALTPGAATVPIWIDGLDAGHRGKAQGAWRYITRFVDIVLATLVLVLLAPVFAVIALLVRATSPGPALFRQVRMGYRGAPFVMLKFRTMYDKSDDTLHREYVSRMLVDGDGFGSGTNGLFKLDQDPRITPLGHFLRRSSLDELPQIFNVLRGEMSLVGPRPPLSWEVELYQQHHHLRFQVKPGITGLWQVSGRNKLSMNEALDLDVRYVREWSLGLDFQILAMTLPALFQGGTR